MTIAKNDRRLKRCRKSKGVIERSDLPRIVISKTLKHVYASACIKREKGHHTLAFASSLENLPEFKTSPAKLDKAKIVGRLLGERLLKTGQSKVAFDRSGYKYHGVVRALADAIREQGIVI
jgi:large subunit ribosomal protein L18